MLDKKVALVTGASRGIGRAIVKKLASENIYVVVNYAGSKDKAEETLDEIEADGGQGEIYCCDVASEEEVKSMAEDLVNRLGRVDILVNNAGITRDKLIMGMSEDDFRKVIDINLFGAFHTIKYLTRNFLKLKGGKIINIASVSGILGNAGQGNYAASKAGIIGLTKTAAREYAGKGICVNAIAPGFIETDMTGNMSEGALKAGIESIPMKRMGKACEVAEAVSFLASDRASYITGQVLCVDGGMAM